MRGLVSTVAAFAIALGASATAFGATVLVTESFTTDPASRGWSGVGNTTPPNNYGWSAGTDNTGTSVAPPGGGATTAEGEAGGSINRGPNSFYGVDLGGPVDFATTDMNVKGVVILTNRGSSTTLNFGWSQGITSVIGDGSDPTNFMGMAWDDGFNGSGGMRARGSSSLGGSGASGPSFPDPSSVTPAPLPFEMDWNAGTLTFTMTLGTNSGTMTVSAGDIGNLPPLTHWGMWGRTNHSPDNANTVFIDDLTFTAVPEPASLALLSLGALGLVRRRRQ